MTAGEFAAELLAGRKYQPTTESTMLQACRHSAGNSCSITFGQHHVESRWRRLKTVTE